VGRGGWSGRANPLVWPRLSPPDCESSTGVCPAACDGCQQQDLVVLCHAVLWCALPNLPACCVVLCLVFTGADPSGSTWQPWTDQLAYAGLAGLVWGGAKLASAAEEHARVMEAVEAYMAARPIKVCCVVCVVPDRECAP
jgi:hypothetical protein